MFENSQPEIELLQTICDWRTQNKQVILATVIQASIHTPRRAGSQFALCEDGEFVGSISGGCAEDELVSSLLDDFPLQAKTICFGGQQQNARAALACGGEIELAIEPVYQKDHFEKILQSIRNKQSVKRRVHIESGQQQIINIESASRFEFEYPWLNICYGPRWRLLIIGAVEIAHYLCPMADMLNFKVAICEPRQSYLNSWRLESTKTYSDSPDQWLNKQHPDQYTAVITLTHDPRFDDIALMEALSTKAFYIGALGSQRSSEKRKQRLAAVDIKTEDIKRLHAPVGLDIKSRSAVEIALSIMAHLVAERNKHNA